jgi:hypothetical protein
MTFINVGAYVNGERPKSKAALRRALAAGERVTFDVTSPLGPRGGDLIDGTPDDVGTDKLQVVGPDPYTTRNWYGTVQVKASRHHPDQLVVS